MAYMQKKTNKILKDLQTKQRLVAEEFDYVLDVQGDSQGKPF